MKELNSLIISEEDKKLIVKINKQLSPLEDKISQFFLIKIENKNYKNLKSIFLFDDKNDYPIFNYKNLLSEIYEQLNIFNKSNLSKIYEDNKINYDLIKNDKNFIKVDYSLENIEKYFTSYLKVEYLDLAKKIYNKDNNSEIYINRINEIFDEINNLNTNDKFLKFFSNKKDIQYLELINKDINKEIRDNKNRKGWLGFWVLMMFLILFLIIMLCLIII